VSPAELSRWSQEESALVVDDRVGGWNESGCAKCGCERSGRNARSYTRNTLSAIYWQQMRTAHVDVLAAGVPELRGS
jgi:hypothetical protein